MSIHDIPVTILSSNMHLLVFSQNSTTERNLVLNVIPEVPPCNFMRDIRLSGRIVELKAIISISRITVYESTKLSIVWPPQIEAQHDEPLLSQ